ncbi:MAG TPA: hypothetical protein VMS71_03815 [Candidatus Acidoferrum sp.]|nr:hypothetical protein [Candidatus Acidoferrum sp.]
MRCKKLTMFLMLLTFALACLISASVYSGEHPWDADKGNGGGGSSGLPGPTDPTQPDPGAGVVASAWHPQPGQGADMRSVLIFRVSYYVTRLFMPGTTVTTSPKQMNLKRDAAR